MWLTRSNLLASAWIYHGHQRAGRIQSAERAVPTRYNRSEGYEPSFSLIRADSRRAMKGDSYVRHPSAPTASQSRAVQEARKELPTRVQIRRPWSGPRLGRTLGRDTCPLAGARNRSRSPTRDPMGHRTSRTTMARASEVEGPF